MREVATGGKAAVLKSELGSTSHKQVASRPPSPPMEPLAYSLGDAGKALGGVSVPTLHRWVKAGKLRVTKLGGRTLIRRAELERILYEAEQAAA